MQFDHVIPGQSEAAVARDASERSLRWLARCREEFARLNGEDPIPGRSEQALFPIVQGGIHADLRREAAAAIRDMDDWAGYGIGGLSVGEAKADMYRILEDVHAVLPADRPRYLMGVGFPDDLVEGVRRGIDLFDCVAPTRMGRHGTAFTPDGTVQIRRGPYRTDRRPLVEGCPCPGCTQYDRAYLRHLFVSEEMLGPRLLALHNVAFLLTLMRDARRALEARHFESWSAEWLGRYGAGTAASGEAGSGTAERDTARL
jgi:queuine tRNA-ribosyltransferase